MSDDNKKMQLSLNRPNVEHFKKEIEDTVSWFSGRMQEKMLTNMYKGSWRGYTTQLLFKRLIDEISELYEALLVGGTEDIIKEASDIANFSMMIADIASQQRSEG